MRALRKGQRGQVLVIVVGGICALCIIAALALDLGRAYGVRAKLYAAADAAAIAAGRVVGAGKSAAVKQAADVFHANYPDGILGATLTEVLPEALNNADGSWTITVVAAASLPTSFAPVWPSGTPAFPIRATATATVRTLDMVVVLDSSETLQDCAGTVRDAAKRFIRNFDQGYDRIGLVHFGSGALLDVPLNASKGFSRQQLEDKIDHIAFGGVTASEDALRMAKDELDAVPLASRNTLRVIVFFSDGAPNTFAGIFDNKGTTVKGNLYSEVEAMKNQTAVSMYDTNSAVSTAIYYTDIKYLPNTDYTGTVKVQSDLKPPLRTLETDSDLIKNTRCNVNMAARNMLENVANAARSESDNPIRIFTIGLGTYLTKIEINENQCDYGNNELGENIMARLANAPGVDTYNQQQPAGIYTYASNETQLNAAFQRVANQLLRLTK